MKRNMKKDEAACYIWPALIDVAARRATITYSDLADVIGSVDHRHGWPLGLIQEYCQDRHLPPLTILVVSKASGLPGHGFTALEADEREAGFEAVWSYPWPSDNPFAYGASGQAIDALAHQLCKDPQTAAATYALVKSRGVAQMVFRRAVLEAYDHQCAFCGVTFEQCLDAAHIIPWTIASPAERVSPVNGLCLCSNHHRLFDAGLLTVDPHGRIIGADAKPDHTYSKADKTLTTSLEKVSALLPKDRRLRPAAASLAHHYLLHQWTSAPWSLNIAAEGEAPP